MSHVIDGVTITDNALTQIVVAAAEQVEGVRVRRRKGVELQDGRVALSLAARVRQRPAGDRARRAGARR